jgi:hypothetical protein
MSSIARHHAEWLSLVEVSGPFLSMEVLGRAFPQGLDKPADEKDVRARLRLALDEWQDGAADPALHRAFVRFALAEVLGLGTEVLHEGAALPPTLSLRIAEHNETLRPDFAVLAPEGRDDAGRPRLLVLIVPPTQGLEKPLARGPAARWAASPAQRMMTLLHGTGVRLGLVTSGEHWMLVHAAPRETTTYASFYTSLLLEEPLTLRAFRSLLSVQRFFGVPEADTLEALMAESARHQHEVTDQLGYQVRHAVELLVQAIDRLDRDADRRLLAGLGGQDTRILYEAAVTVMMRLVFLLAAEERGLLPSGSACYQRHYAVSPLREQLREVADRHGEEVLERRFDAWSRLLATFRAVHGGARHEDLALPAYGGSLFDPDRYPFLEGRDPGTRWHETPAAPLAIHNRTVLYLLEALQLLEVRVAGGPAEARRLSFRALGVEQIGHVYEGLLDHTAVRASGPVLGLRGTRDREPEIPIDELEARRKKDEAALLDYLKEETGRSASALRKELTYEDAAASDGPYLADLAARVLAACDNDRAVYGRVAPFAGLLRLDPAGEPVVFPAGSVYVTAGTDRRSSGTHYTPPSLTGPIVRHALDPLVYEGPAEGWPAERWRLRSAAALLDLKICDLAMGSGAFLAEACRYLAQRLCEAWAAAEKESGGELHVTPHGVPSRGSPGERLLPHDAEERLVMARRIVADRCLYGVDRNPMAVEIAKLSLWLETLQKDRPFTFLDHALRSGDSLLGTMRLEQVEQFHVDPKPGTELALFAQVARRAVERATKKRQEIESFTTEHIEDAQAKARLLAEAEAEQENVRVLGDLVVGAAMRSAGKRGAALDAQMKKLAEEVARALDEREPAGVRAERWAALRERARELLEEGNEYGRPPRRPFHWAVEFPEVMARGGFDAIVGNPPFQGGKLISGILGTDYRDYLVQYLAGGVKGHADLCAYFFLRAKGLLREGGSFALLATNTIAQGDTREVGLDQIVEQGAIIVRAVPSRPWPGTASLEVAHVWARRGGWAGPYVLDDKEAPGITAFLATPGEVSGKPHRLAENAGKSFIGSYVLGMGFVMAPEEAQALVKKDPRNKDVLFPYLNGEDLNSRPDQSASRWVINFFDWPEERARSYPDCWRIIEERVKDERQRKKPDGTYALRSPLPQRYWHYADKRPALYATIEGMERVLVLCLVTQHVGIAFTPADRVFAHKLAVFSIATGSSFGILQSSHHEIWARTYSSSLETRLNYSPSDCFETFPFPRAIDALNAIGTRYDAHRRSILRSRQEGLTKTYNRFHDPAEAAADIAELRRLHVEMDQAVAGAYGWHDLDLGHGFHPTKQGLRYTLSEPARREVLARLLRLNHERHAAEVAAAGGEPPKSKKGARKKPKTDPAGPGGGQAGFGF